MKGLKARRKVEGIVSKLQLGDRVGGRVYVCYVREIVKTMKGVKMV